MSYIVNKVQEQLKNAVYSAVEAAVKKAKAGEVQYRVEKNGIVHAGIGKASFSEDQIYENSKAYPRSFQQLILSQPAVCLGKY